MKSYVGGGTLAHRIDQGRFHLIGPSALRILPEIWPHTLQPGSEVELQLWDDDDAPVEGDEAERENEGDARERERENERDLRERERDSDRDLRQQERQTEKDARERERETERDAREQERHRGRDARDADRENRRRSQVVGSSVNTSRSNGNNRLEQRYPCLHFLACRRRLGQRR